MADDRDQRQTMAPASFVKGFIAQLVLEGWHSISSRDPRVHRGFKRVVELLDERVRDMMSDDADMRQAGPWIEAGNLLRISPTGGVENWERALRAAQMTFTRPGGGAYDSVLFEIDKIRAQAELSHLASPDRRFVEAAAKEFIARAAPTE